MYQTYVVGLNGQGSDIVVYDGEDCSDLRNILDCCGRLLVVNPSTSNQYPVGQLGPKMGGVRGTNHLYNHEIS